MIEMLTKKPLIELWITEVGSVMWGMDTLASDHDYVITFACRDFDVLTGKAFSALPQKTKVPCAPGSVDKRTADISAMEIGHLIHLLKKGNVNALWSVMSPQIVSSLISNPFHSDMKDLRAIVRKNLSSISCHSIQGMALSQLSDAIKRADVRDPQKSYATALRTINFGIQMLTEGKITFLCEYNDVLDNVLDSSIPDIGLNEEMVQRALGELEDAFKNSILPSEVPEEPFDNYLYQLRKKIARIDARYFAMKVGLS